MNEDIAMRTLAYLITHYKEHDETIINSEEIEAIEFLQQENQKYKEVINKAIEFSNKNWGTWCSNHLEYMTELQNILKEVD